MTVQNALLQQYQVALDRLENGGDEKSYTAYLYGQGLDKILKKCGEETFEAVIAAKNADEAELAGELNDVLYHTTVLICFTHVTMQAVLDALNRRCRLENAAIEDICAVIEQRCRANEEGSYTAYLYREGLDKVLKKIGEACSLLIIAAKNQDPDAIAEQMADLIYHILVMLTCKGLPAQIIADEMERRSRKSGNLKQFHTTDKTT